MSKPTYISTIILLFAIFYGAESRIYEPGDWVNYRDFRYVISGDIGRDFVYFATTGGLMRYSLWKSSWGEPMTVALIPGGTAVFDTVYSVAFDDNRRWLWCGTSDGLFSYNTLSDYWELYQLPDGFKPILSIGLQGDTIWLEGGFPAQNWRTIYKGSAGSGNFQISSQSELAQAQGVVWHGEKGSLPEEYPRYFINNERLTFDPKGKLNDMYWNNYPLTFWTKDDIRRTVYLGFYGYGAGVVDDNTKRMDVFRYGPKDNEVKHILKEGNTFFIVGSGFTEWDRGKDKWKYYLVEELVGLASNDCRDIVKHRDKIYIATKLGLAIMDRESGRFHTLSTLNNLNEPEVTALDTRDNELWIGTAQGINSMRYVTEQVQRLDAEAVKNFYINDLKIDGNYVWVGTQFGLFLHDLNAGDWTYVRGSDEMVDSQVREININKNEVWFARGAGIEFFDKNKGDFTAYESVFFGNNTALSILPGDSLVWVGTREGGLYKFDRKMNRWVEYTTQDDGLPSNKIYCILQEGDYLWIGTANGLCRFYWNDPYRLD